MAKSNLKKINDQNKRILKTLKNSLIISNLTNLIVKRIIIKFLRSKEDYSSIRSYLISTSITLVLLSILISSSSKNKNSTGRNNNDYNDDSPNEDLSSGIYQYFIDFCYLSCFVWVLDIFSESVWKIYYLVPIYGTYKILRAIYSIARVAL